MYLVHRLTLAFGDLGYSSKADVGPPIATEYVWGVPQLITARFPGPALPALAKPEDESVGTASPSLGLQRLPMMRP
jgi:hypothetical protein